MAGSLNEVILTADRLATLKPCERCGKAFNRPAAPSTAQWESRRFCSKHCAGMRRRAKDEEILGLYRGGRSTGEIAPLVGISATHVARIVRAAGITRSATERQKLSHSRPEVRERNSLSHQGRPCPEYVKERLRKRTGSAHPSWRSGLTIDGGYIAFTASPANGEHARIVMDHADHNRLHALKNKLGVKR